MNGEFSLNILSRIDGMVYFRDIILRCKPYVKTELFISSWKWEYFAVDFDTYTENFQRFLDIIYPEISRHIMSEIPDRFYI